MESAIVSFETLPKYRLKFCFSNGSEAIIDMSRRIHGMRFYRLADPIFFLSAKLCNNEVVWRDGADSIRISINELLDSMQM